MAGVGHVRPNKERGASDRVAPFPAVPCGSGRGVRSTLSCRSSSSLDHLVGVSEERLRHGEAERLGGLEVNYQLEFGRFLYRQIGGISTLEDSSDVNTGFAKDRREAHSIANQAAGLDALALNIDRR